MNFCDLPQIHNIAENTDDLHIVDNYLCLLRVVPSSGETTNHVRDFCVLDTMIHARY
jgi:hypothetical protein